MSLNIERGFRRLASILAIPLILWSAYWIVQLLENSVDLINVREAIRQERAAQQFYLQRASTGGTMIGPSVDAAVELPSNDGPGFEVEITRDRVGHVEFTKERIAGLEDVRADLSGRQEQIWNSLGIGIIGFMILAGAIHVYRGFKPLRNRSDEVE